MFNKHTKTMTICLPLLFTNPFPFRMIEIVLTVAIAASSEANSQQ